VALVPPRMRAAAAGVAILAGYGFLGRALEAIRLAGMAGGLAANDAARRERIREAAAYLEPRYVRGTGIVTSSYPLTSVFREMKLAVARRAHGR